MTQGGMILGTESSDFTPHWTGSTHHVGAFSLTTQTGAPITDRGMAGRVHVASFIYTRCSAICPTLVSNLKRVQAAIVDPNVVVTVCLRIESFDGRTAQKTEGDILLAR